MLKENNFILEYLVDMFLTRADLSDRIVLYTHNTITENFKPMKVIFLESLVDRSWYN